MRIVVRNEESFECEKFQSMVKTYSMGWVRLTNNL